MAQRRRLASLAQDLSATDGGEKTTHINSHINYQAQNYSQKQGGINALLKPLAHKVAQQNPYPQPTRDKHLQGKLWLAIYVFFTLPCLKVGGGYKGKGYFNSSSLWFLR